MHSDILHWIHDVPQHGWSSGVGTTTLWLSDSALHTTGNPISHLAAPFPKTACFRLSALGTFPHWAACSLLTFLLVSPPLARPSIGQCFRPRWNITMSTHTNTSPLPSLRDVTSSPTHLSAPRRWAHHVIGPAASRGTTNRG